MTKDLGIVVHTVLFVVAFASAGLALSAEQHLQGADSKEMPLTISLADRLDDLERSPVQFRHQKHADFFKEKGCAACHLANEQGIFSFAFPSSVQKQSLNGLRQAYHAQCIGCHRDRSRTVNRKPPVTCGECHSPAVVSAWLKPVGYDYYMHAKHENAAEKKCETCHHVYDQTQQKLVYQKGAEESCRSCHRDIPEEKRPSFPTASHTKCVNCHLEKFRERRTAGPLTCEGCHFQLKERTVAELKDVARPQRNQPENPVITVAGASISSVPFPHKAHEYASRNCRECHHQTLQSCKKCHSLTGRADGGGITLEDAYHRVSASWSCKGCHSLKKAEASCAGCHCSTVARMQAGEGCEICHRSEITVPAAIPEPLPLDALLPVQANRTITLGTLESKYKASEFPHYKIVKALTERANASQLAKSFHASDTTLCLGCHHAGPVKAQIRPAACRNCHTVTPSPDKLNQPRLLAVYHLQCVGCHQRMDIMKQSCTDCHAAKQPASGQMTVNVSQGGSER